MVLTGVQWSSVNAIKVVFASCLTFTAFTSCIIKLQLNSWVTDHTVRLSSVKKTNKKNYNALKFLDYSHECVNIDTPYT